jgi:AcrR family transcriptional regulator
MPPTATAVQVAEKPKVDKKVLRGLKTAESLLDIARQAFASRGFAATTTQDIITKANVTKGALYHHFPSKAHLFEAVYRRVEGEIAGRIDAASAVVDEPWEKLISGCDAYLEACQDPAAHRILRIDGPAVLGQSTWAQIDHEFGLARLLPFLNYLADQGVLRVPSVEAFGRQLTGAMNEATFWIAGHSDPKQALRDSKLTLRLLLQGVRVC